MTDTRTAVLSRLRKAWLAAGRPSGRELSRRFLTKYGFSISNTAISAYLGAKPEVPGPPTMNLKLMVCFAWEFGAELRDWSPTLAARVDAAEAAIAADTEFFAHALTAGVTRRYWPGQLTFAAPRVA